MKEATARLGLPRAGRLLFTRGGVPFENFSQNIEGEDGMNELFLSMGEPFISYEDSETFRKSLLLTKGMTAYQEETKRRQQKVIEARWVKLVCRRGFLG